MSVDRAADPSDAIGADPRSDNTSSVHERLRGAILRGELVAGAPLSQPKLARALGVSRTPLREALRLLEREGLVDSVPNQSMRVARVSTSDLEEIYAMRILLESLALRLTIPHLKEEDFDTAQAYLDRMDDLAELRNFDEWEIPHRAFHALLTSGAAHRLSDSISKLSEHAARYRRVYTIAAEPASWFVGAREHKALLDACRARDTTAAGGILMRHYLRTALTVLSLAAPEHEPIAVRAASYIVDGHR
jgi:DNA-binding GntR family transcriptional regulator